LARTETIETASVNDSVETMTRCQGGNMMECSLALWKAVKADNENNMHGEKHSELLIGLDVKVASEYRF